VVNIGDSYCYDLWCLGVNHVNATPRGRDILYTADVDADVTVQPGESVESSLAFLAPLNARKLYLMGNADQVSLPWVYLYFGSDVVLFHRSALVPIL
jgi:hypothetical protein